LQVSAHPSHEMPFPLTKSPERSTIPAVVTLVEELGAEAFVYSQIADDHLLIRDSSERPDRWGGTQERPREG
jgi:hypothetical protein